MNCQGDGMGRANVRTGLRGWTFSRRLVSNQLRTKEGGGHRPSWVWQCSRKGTLLPGDCRKRCQFLAKWNMAWPWDPALPGLGVRPRRVEARVCGGLLRDSPAVQTRRSRVCQLTNRSTERGTSVPWDAACGYRGAKLTHAAPWGNLGLTLNARSRSSQTMSVVA